MIDISETERGVLRDLAKKASNDCQEAVLRVASLVEGPNSFAIQMAATVNMVDLTAGITAELMFGGDEEKAVEETLNTIRGVLAMRRQMLAARKAAG